MKILIKEIMRLLLEKILRGFLYMDLKKKYM
jgi:hypothetical protein